MADLNPSHVRLARSGGIGVGLCFLSFGEIFEG